MPLAVAPSPEASFASDLRDAAERNLDYEIAQQVDGGSWLPAWSWAGEYPAA